MINGEQLRYLLYLMKHLSIFEEEKVCSKEFALNRRMNMPTSFSCIFRVRAHGKKLAYKHKMTGYLRDRSLEGSAQLENDIQERGRLIISAH